MIDTINEAEDVELMIKNKDGVMIHLGDITAMTYTISRDTYEDAIGRVRPIGGGSFEIDGFYLEEYDTEEEKGWNKEGSNCPFGDK